RDGGIATACPLYQSVAIAWTVHPFSADILRGQLRRRLAHRNRRAPQAPLNISDRGGNRGEHRLRGSTGSGRGVVPTATISRRCRGSHTPPRYEAHAGGLPIGRRRTPCSHPGGTNMSASTSTNIRHAFYILAGAVALVLTWPHAFRWMAAGGNILNPVQFFGDAMAPGGTAAFLSIDMALAWVGFLGWGGFGSQRIGLGYKWGWV